MTHIRVVSASHGVGSGIFGANLFGLSRNHRNGDFMRGNKTIKILLTHWHWNAGAFVHRNYQNHKQKRCCCFKFHFKKLLLTLFPFTWNNFFQKYFRLARNTCCFLHNSNVNETSHCESQFSLRLACEWQTFKWSIVNQCNRTNTNEDDEQAESLCKEMFYNDYSTSCLCRLDDMDRWVNSYRDDILVQFDREKFKSYSKLIYIFDAMFYFKFK